MAGVQEGREVSADFATIERRLRDWILGNIESGNCPFACHQRTPLALCPLLNRTEQQR